MHKNVKLALTSDKFLLNKIKTQTIWLGVSFLYDNTGSWKIFKKKGPFNTEPHSLKRLGRGFGVFSPKLEKVKIRKTLLSFSKGPIAKKKFSKDQIFFISRRSFMSFSFFYPEKKMRALSCLSKKSILALKSEVKSILGISFGIKTQKVRLRVPFYLNINKYFL